MSYDLGDFGIVLYNTTKDFITIENTTVVGVYQNKVHLQKGAEAIIFPEGLTVERKITSAELVALVSHLAKTFGGLDKTKDDKTGYEYINCGEKWINLTTNWRYQDKEVIYPITITLNNSVIEEMRMIFIDKK